MVNKFLSVYLPTNMDDTLTFKQLIDRAVERDWDGKVSTAERAAGLKPDTIRNLMRSENTKGPTLETARRIAEGLGLEFYVGPRRPESGSVYGQPILGFAETRAVMDNPELAPRSDQLFLPIPNHRASGTSPGAGPIAFMQDWFDNLGQPPDHLSFVTLDGDSMAPTIPRGALVLVDESQRPNLDAGQAAHPDHRPFVIVHEGKSDAHRLMPVDKNHVVVTSAQPDYVPVILTHNQLQTTHRVLGRVVWTSHVMQGD